MPAFGPWQPDKGGVNSGTCATCEGVIPQAAAQGLGYGPFPSLTVPGGAGVLGGTPRGGLSAQKTDGNWAFFVATDTTIEELQSDYTWSSIDTLRTYTVGDDVSFALFGNYLISTDTTEGMKAYNVITPAGNNAVSTAPAARAVFVMNNVLFALGSAAEPNAFQSSDINDHTNWSSGAADGKVFEDGGALVGGADLKNGLGVMFQERAIRFVQFGDGASTYTLTKISDGIGCVSERTIVAYDGRVAWWDDDGPWMMDTSGAPRPIGHDKIVDWAAANIGSDQYSQMQGAYDPERKVFLWRVDESRLLCYAWLVDEWSVLPVSTSALFRIAVPAGTFDSLTGSFDDLTGTFNELGGGISSPSLCAINSALKFASFTGTNMAVTLETGVIAQPATLLFRWATPDDDADGGTLQVGVSDRRDVALTWKSGNSRTDSGRVEMRARGKLFAFRRNIPAGTSWTYVNGVEDLDIRAGGPK